MTNIQEFIEVLNDIIDNYFPNTKRYIIHGGDSIKNFVLELREGNKKLRYSPYELFNKSDNYEETIEQFIEQWKNILNS